MTLIELTVVILVLLALISILFVGTRAYKRGADRSGCIMNLRNAQQSARSFQNFNRLDGGEAYDFAADLIGPGKFLERIPECPGRGTYSYSATIPEPGFLAMSCSLAGTEGHEPEFPATW